MTDDTAVGAPALGTPAPPAARGVGRRPGLALLVISLTQLVLVLDELGARSYLAEISR